MNAILLIFTIIILNCFGGLHSDFLNLLSIYYKTVYVYITHCITLNLTEKEAVHHVKI